MSYPNEITVTIQNPQKNNVSVYVDEKGISIAPIFNFINKLQTTYDTHQNAASLVLKASSDWQKTHEDFTSLKMTLSAGWQETFGEVNVIQSSLSSNWQKSYEIIKTGIFDAGNF
jgi:hypothetical protein